MAKRQNPEYELQKQVVEYLKLRQLLFCASAGGMRTNMLTAIKMKKAGYIKGFPDIFIYETTEKYSGMAIELKSEKGKLSDEQKEWGKQLMVNGYYYIMGNNFYEIVKEIDAYLLS